MLVEEAHPDYDVLQLAAVVFRCWSFCPMFYLFVYALY